MTRTMMFLDLHNPCYLFIRWQRREKNRGVSLREIFLEIFQSRRYSDFYYSDFNYFDYFYTNECEKLDTKT